jgi:hypothetical protein
MARLPNSVGNEPVDLTAEMELIQAERLVAKCEKNVSNQREMLEELRRGGHDTEDAIFLLREAEEILELYRKDRDRLRARAGTRAAR